MSDDDRLRRRHDTEAGVLTPHSGGESPFENSIWSQPCRAIQPPRFKTGNSRQTKGEACRCSPRAKTESWRLKRAAANGCCAATQTGNAPPSRVSSGDWPIPTGAAAAFGAGLLTPPLNWIEGLHRSHEFSATIDTGHRLAVREDLRSAQAAGSGDPRRAQASLREIVTIVSGRQNFP